MKELTLVFDCFGHKELKQYLNSLNGVLEVIIKNEDNLEIYIRYDSKLITFRMLKSEIFLFLDISKVPSMIAFNKHSNAKTSKYIISNQDIYCCEYCLKGLVDDLFEIDGIEKVESNYFVNNNCNLIDNIIEISYNPNVISEDEIKTLEI